MEGAKVGLVQARWSLVACDLCIPGYISLCFSFFSACLMKGVGLPWSLVARFAEGCVKQASMSKSISYLHCFSYVEDPGDAHGVFLPVVVGKRATWVRYCSSLMGSKSWRA